MGAFLVPLTTSAYAPTKQEHRRAHSVYGFENARNRWTSPITPHDAVSTYRGSQRSQKATERIRTVDLRFTKPLLCQLSYGGAGRKHIQDNDLCKNTWQNWLGKTRRRYLRFMQSLLGLVYSANAAGADAPSVVTTILLFDNTVVIQ